MPSFGRRAASAPSSRCRRARPPASSGRAAGRRRRSIRTACPRSTVPGTAFGAWSKASSRKAAAAAVVDPAASGPVGFQQHRHPVLRMAEQGGGAGAGEDAVAHHLASDEGAVGLGHRQGQGVEFGRDRELGQAPGPIRRRCRTSGTGRSARSPRAAPCGPPASAASKRAATGHRTSSRSRAFATPRSALSSTSDTAGLADPLPIGVVSTSEMFLMRFHPPTGFWAVHGAVRPTGLRVA